METRFYFVSIFWGSDQDWAFLNVIWWAMWDSNLIRIHTEMISYIEHEDSNIVSLLHEDDADIIRDRDRTFSYH